MAIVSDNEAYCCYCKHKIEVGANVKEGEKTCPNCKKTYYLEIHAVTTYHCKTYSTEYAPEIRQAKRDKAWEEYLNPLRP